MFIARLAALAGLALLAVSTQAHALTAAECHDKYKAAEAAGTLNGRSWTPFKNAECGPGSKPAAAKEEPIDALKNEMKQAGYSDQAIQTAFAALNIGPIANKCVEDGYEDRKVVDLIAKGIANSGVKMTDSQIDRYYKIDKLPFVELLTYQGLSDELRYEFCMSKRRYFAAFGMLSP